MLKKYTAPKAAILFLSAILAMNASGSGSLADCDQALYEEIRDKTVTPLFEALRNGQLSVIRSHLSEGTKSEYEALFTQNANYGQFLRDYYADTQFELVDIESRDGAYVAVVSLHWADGRSTKIRLGLGGEHGQLSRDVSSDSCQATN